MGAESGWHVVDVVNDAGGPFRVVYGPAGREGPNAARHPGCSTHDEVEFFDRRLSGGLGGYVSSYRAQDLIMDPPRGLNLSGGNPGWHIDRDTMAVVMLWLEHVDSPGDRT